MNMLKRFFGKKKQMPYEDILSNSHFSTLLKDRLSGCDYTMTLPFFTLDMATEIVKEALKFAAPEKRFAVLKIIVEELYPEYRVYKVHTRRKKNSPYGSDNKFCNVGQINNFEENKIK